MKLRGAMRAKGRCPKRVKAETVQHDNTDPTPLLRGSWNDDVRGLWKTRGEQRGVGCRTQLSSMPMKNEWKLPLQHEGGTATLKESFEIGELVHDEKPGCNALRNHPEVHCTEQQKETLATTGDSVRDSRVQQSTLSTRTNLESRAEQWRTVSI